VFLFDAAGSFRASFTPGGSGALINPEGIGVFEDDNGETIVFVADTGNNRIVKFRHDNNNSDGLRFIDAAGSGGSGSDRFNQPAGMTVDSCGNVWVADRLNNRIQRLDQDLTFRNGFSSGFNRPNDITLDDNQGSLYVVDTGNDRIQKFNLN
jgi:tripartite motif-containing protein 71